MSADGYFRVPRKLATASISPERVAALLWIASQASYVPREVEGVMLDVGETPPIAASDFERRFKWTRKAARVFLEYALSDRCADETGIRIRVGKKSKGPALGPGVGPSQGPTYVVRLQRLTMDEGPALGPGVGPSQGPTVNKKVVEEGKNTPPTGESRGGDSKTATKRTRRTPTAMTADWEPDANNRLRCTEWHLNLTTLLSDFRDHWIRKEERKADWNRTFRNRMVFCVDHGLFVLNGNGRSRGGLVLADGEMERVRGVLDSRSDSDAEPLPW